jgi:hypothetical protein
MVERLLLHAISIFKDLVPKKKLLYVTEFYVFRSSSKPSSISRKRAATASAQQTKVWNKEVNCLLRLGSELFASKPSFTFKKRAVAASMTASSRQKKKKQLIVKLRVRQLKQKQEQEQEQRNNVISITGQSGRRMRIRRAPKRSY